MLLVAGLAAASATRSVSTALTTCVNAVDLRNRLPKNLDDTSPRLSDRSDRMGETAMTLLPQNERSHGDCRACS